MVSFINLNMAIFTAKETKDQAFLAPSSLKTSDGSLQVCKAHTKKPTLCQYRKKEDHQEVKIQVQ